MLDPGLVYALNEESRERKLHIDKLSFDLIDGHIEIPNVGYGKALIEARDAIKRAINGKKKIMFAFGGHVIKVGLGKLLIKLILHTTREGADLSFHTNGSGIIHDAEIALTGRTSEYVDEAIKDGSFGDSEVARFINSSISKYPATLIHDGYGTAMVKAVHAHCKFPGFSFLHFCKLNNIPVTVHTALGADINHMEIGKTDVDYVNRGLYRDLIKFEEECAKLEGGGVFICAGSAVIIPEIFLKVITGLRRRMNTLNNFTTIAIDFKDQYRVRKNVVERPTSNGGKGIYLLSPHEIILPLLFKGVF